MKSRLGAVLSALTVTAVVAGVGARVEAASITDVTFRGANADAAVGPIDGNDSLAVAQNYFGGGWDGFLRDAGSTTLNDYLGINWTVSAELDETEGTWSLTLTDPAPISLPVTTDIFVVLKGGDSWAGYLFEAETFLVEGSYPGTYLITFLNNGGRFPDLSHLSVYLRQADGPDPDPDGVPEPTTMVLFGLGMLGAGIARRRRS